MLARYHQIKFGFLLIIVILVGCNHNNDTINVSAELERLNLNHSKWNSLNVSTYSYHFHRGCFCGPESTRKVIITVSQQLITDIQPDVAAGEDTTPIPTEQYSYYETVESLFTYLENAIKEHPFKLIVTYDSQYGAPTYIYVDPIEFAVDEEESFSLSIDWVT